LIHINELTPTTLMLCSKSRQAKEVAMPVLPRQKRRPSLFAPILAWWTDRVRAIAPFAGERLTAAQASNVVEDAGPSGEAPDLPHYSYDASLLFRRMALLQVDRDELASDDPLLFRELQALCTLCRSKERCVLDLAQDEPGNREWREYCLNATTLNALGAVQNCARAAQYLRTPRSTGSSWPGLSRPSTSLPRQRKQDVDARHKAGHHESLIETWYKGSDGWAQN
jgi:hypothetical protein